MRRSPRSQSRTKPRRPPHDSDRAVIPETPSWVAQALAGFDDLSHTKRCVGIGRCVRVVLQRKAAKGRFDDLGVRGGIDLEGLVIRSLAAIADSGNSRVLQTSQELRLGQYLVEK